MRKSRAEGTDTVMNDDNYHQLSNPLLESFKLNLMKPNSLLPRSFMLCILFMLCIGDAFAQVRKVTGTITDEEGEMLPGTTVLVKGTTTGTITDAKGNYSIEISGSSRTLVFSFTGFTPQEVPVEDRSQINVKMVPDANQLSEVVVTAFGIEREKKALGYSVQVVDGSRLTEARESNVANSLKGKVAGLHVNPSSGGAGGSSYVMIRGNSSLAGNGQPLYVVDGVPIDNQTLDGARVDSGRDYGDGINNINPDDIENLTVLKGPAAASIYGARGSNGVILITTKKGTRGKGIGVDINSNITIEKPNVIPTQQNVWGGGYDGSYGSFGTRTVDGVEYSTWPSWLADSWGGKMDGRPILIDRWLEAGPVPYTGQASDNIKDFFKTGVTKTNTIGVSGGAGAVTYRVSVSDMHNKGIIPNTKLERQTVNVRISADVSSNLSVDGKINYVRQRATNRPQINSYSQNPMTALNLLPRFMNLERLKTYKKEDGTMTRVNGSLNPYWTVNELTGFDTRDRVIGFLSAKYKFTNWLSLQVRSGTDFYTDIRYEQINQYTSGENGRITNTQFFVKEGNSDLLLNAAGKLSRKLTGSLSLGANRLDRNQEVLGNTGTNLNVPGLYYIGNTRNVVPRQYTTRKRMNSVYFTGQIAYENFLFVDITGRNDWSSTLGNKDQSFFYPSIASSFVFSDVAKWNQEILSYGKLRASYAEAGNDASPYQTRAGYTVTSSTTFNDQPFANIRTNIPLLNLKNELKRSYEFGAELRFWNNRLGLDLTYYNASTVNQILPLEISSSTGYTTRLINAGEIRNRGYEIFLTAMPVKTKNFNWDLSLNLSNNKSKVVSLAPNITTLTLMDPGYGASIQARTGEAFGNIVGYRFLRNENGDKLLTAEGKYQRAADLEVLGRIQPDYLAGLTNTFSYKALTVSALVDVRKGGQILSYSKLNQMAKGTGKFTENRENLIADGVIETGPGEYKPSDIVISAEAYYAEAGPWNNIGETQVIDADYVAFREFSIGYNLKSLIKENKFFRQAKLSIVGRNLFYFYRDAQFKEMGISPETAFSTATAAQGYETVAMPTTRSLGFNLSLSF
jgi:TonB-linked SusC/RagA family outer membrane protein